MTFDPRTDATIYADPESFNFIPLREVFSDKSEMPVFDLTGHEARRTPMLCQTLAKAQAGVAAEEALTEATMHMIALKMRHDREMREAVERLEYCQNIVRNFGDFYDAAEIIMASMDSLS